VNGNIGDQKRGRDLQFRIKGQDYFLAFVEQEKRWYLFSPNEDGLNRIPVYVDAAKYDKPDTLGKNTQNMLG